VAEFNHSECQAKAVEQLQRGASQMEPGAAAQAWATLAPAAAVRQLADTYARINRPGPPTRTPGR
jgi:hypothetical protein